MTSRRRREGTFGNGCGAPTRFRRPYGVEGTRPRRRPPTWSRGRAERATEMPRKPRRSRQLSVGGQGRRLVREKAPRGWRGRGSEETKATFTTHERPPLPEPPIQVLAETCTVDSASRFVCESCQASSHYYWSASATEHLDSETLSKFHIWILKPWSKFHIWILKP